MVPSAMLGAAGVTPIETNVAGVTVNATAGELTPPNEAVTWEVPVAALVAKPFEPAVLLIVAAVPVALHVTDVVKF